MVSKPRPQTAICTPARLRREVAGPGDHEGGGHDFEAEDPLQRGLLHPRAGEGAEAASSTRASPSRAYDASNHARSLGSESATRCDSAQSRQLLQSELELLGAFRQPEGFELRRAALGVFAHEHEVARVGHWNESITVLDSTLISHRQPVTGSASVSLPSLWQSFLPPSFNSTQGQENADLASGVGRSQSESRSLKLEELQPDAAVRGILPNGTVEVVSVQWHGSEALTLIYRPPSGGIAEEILYRHDEARLEVVEQGRPWSFDGDGSSYRLVSEARRIRLAHLFDPVLAVHTSLVEPLPHQITAVYEAMLPRQPLRFLLADDPGAGKTIMAGLLIKELIARGDLERCLVVCPGSLVEQWQDELYRRFGLPFDILTNDKLEAARTGNWFLETDLAIARLDKLARNEDIHAKLGAPDCRYDLVICDEAHKCRRRSSGEKSGTPSATSWVGCCPA